MELPQAAAPTGVPGPPTRVVGLLGGVASGKSTAARALAGPDGAVIAADALAQAALDGPEVRARVADAFGPEVLDPTGRPDRARLAERVFADPAARRRLEGWIHPIVRATILTRLAEARARSVPVVVLDVPLLLENDEQHHLVDECDVLVFVDTPAEDRDARARADRGWSAGEVARRERVQLPLDEKRRRADHVLPNDGPRSELIQAAEALRARLLEDARRSG